MGRKILKGPVGGAEAEVAGLAGNAAKRGPELLTGASGSLGRTILARHKGITGLSRDELDITDRAAVRKSFEKIGPSIVYNCAAETDVDGCESSPDKCWKANAYGVKNLAEACRDFGALLVQVSSDYAANPVNEYGWSKKAGELLALDGGLVLRTNLYGRDSFIPRKLLAGEKVTAFKDNRFNPISYPSFADATVGMARNGIKGLHCIGTNRPISFHAFALKFCEAFGLPGKNVEAAAFRQIGAATRQKDLFFKPENSLSIEEDLQEFRKSIKKV